MNHNSPIIWLSGMSGAGKTALSKDLESLFIEKDYNVYVLDGDDIRGKDAVKLGFGHADVMTNNLRIADLCNDIRNSYDAIIVPVISPYNDVRVMVRKKLQPNFHLIYLKADIDSLRKRDTKGLYLASDKGLINDLIGYSDVNPFEEPVNPDLIVDTGQHTDIDDSKKALFNYINRTIFVNKYIY